MTPLVLNRADRTLERLYRRHVADVYRYSLALCGNPADAEDATQTTFLNAYRALQKGDRPREPHHWLIKIAHNVCRQRFRDAARRPSEVELPEEGLRAPDAGEAPSAGEIRRALGALALNQRAALVMREMQGRSYDEIATVLGVSTSAVETLLFRARRALREQLEGGLTCGAAEKALSLDLDGRLAADGRRELRAHLRECKECATLARSLRARRAAIRSIGFAPLPASLASGSVLGGGAAAVGGTAASKGAAVAASAPVLAGAAAIAVEPAEGPLVETPAVAERMTGLAPEQRTRNLGADADAIEQLALRRHRHAVAARGNPPERGAVLGRTRATTTKSAKTVTTRRATAPRPTSSTQATAPAARPRSPAQPTAPAARPRSPAQPTAPPTASEPPRVAEQTPPPAEPRGRAVRRRPTEGLTPPPQTPPPTPPGQVVRELDPPGKATGKGQEAKKP